MQNLKPCPFCGSNDLIEESSGAFEIHGECIQTCYIECNNCGTEGPRVELRDGIGGSMDFQLVRDAWNKRICNRVLYADKDLHVPSEICDRNCQVVLSMCKICGKAENEL